MKAGAKAFIDEMNPDGTPCDEAAILSFSSSDSLDMPMTHDKEALKRAVDNIRTGGVTALWDAVAAGIYELLRSAKNECRAIIVLSDGEDNRSQTHNLESVIRLALADSVRVFTIGLGSAADRFLPELARRTGGSHYQTLSGDNLAEIYSAIRAGIVGWSWPFCVLEYESDCPDGTERLVELKLKDYCGGTVVQSRSYTAPYLPHLFKPVTLRLPTMDVIAESDFVLPLLLETPVQGIFSKAQVTIGYDHNLIEFMDVSTSGTLLAGRAVSFQPLQSAVLIRLEEDVELDTHGGILLNLHFRALNPKSTVWTNIMLLDWRFDAYCLSPNLRNTSIQIRAREALLTCEAIAPASLVWNDVEKGYEPASFDVSVAVANSGNKMTENVRARIVVDPAVIHLVNPTEAYQFLTPRNIAPGASAMAAWTVSLSGYNNIDRIPILFEIEVDDQLYTRCEAVILLDSALSPAMHCHIDAPDILRWNEVEKRFDNNPFSVSVVVNNAGSLPARNVRAVLTADPSALRLVSPDRHDQLLVPSNIPSGGRAEAQWILEATGREVDDDVSIHIAVESDNIPSHECEHLLRIQAARSSEISCEITVPDSLTWNQLLKRYEPNPFPISVTIRNTGNREAVNVHATLMADEKVFRLLVPVTAQQYATPRTIPPASIATVQWTVEAKEQGGLTNSAIQVSVNSDNHAPVFCGTRIVTDEALRPSITCGIDAPDTIFFRDQYYDPDEFEIDVHVRNIGNGTTRGVTAQLLQDTRFAIVSTASRHLADVLTPGEAASATFRLRVHVRDTDGYDTIRVNVQGDDTDPVWCHFPVWVQRVRMPRFELHCSATADSLVYNDTSQEYEPNPLRITALARNVGETWAEDCQIMLVGPALFTPIGVNLHALGTMFVDDLRRQEWSVRALPRSVSGWDTLTLQILGRGGLDRGIVMEECRLPIFVPAMRHPEYNVECDAPDTLFFRENGYHPDPFVYTARITNSGSAIGYGLRASIELPATLSLADGESNEKQLPSLGLGETADFSWRIRAEARIEDGEYGSCIHMADSSGSTAACCVDVFVQGSVHPVLTVSCYAVDTLFVDKESGEYAGNPFDVTLAVANIGSATAENVQARLIVPGSFVRILDDAVRAIGDLEAGDSDILIWKVQAIGRELRTDVAMSIVLSADRHDALECRSVVHLPTIPAPVLQASCSMQPTDSLFFDWDTGEFEYSECTITLITGNWGETDARNVTALLLAPSGISLVQGETALKQLDPSVLKPGHQGRVSWRFRAERFDEDAHRDFRVIVRADNAADAECAVSLFVQGSPKLVLLSFPDHVLLRHTQKQDIPVYIDRTIGKDVSEYVLVVEYDEDVLHIHDVTNAHTLTSIGWVGARIMSRSAGRIEISDYTTGSSLSGEPGVLLALRAEGVFNGNPLSGAFGESSIRIDEATSRLNRGAIRLTTRDGRVIVTNECLEPLVATDDYGLKLNRPNPFNPITIIEYVLPSDDYVRLRVFDRHGREVALLVDGMREKGLHAVTFNATALPSGMYFYRLESSRIFQTRKMVLCR